MCVWLLGEKTRGYGQQGRQLFEAQKNKSSNLFTLIRKNKFVTTMTHYNKYRTVLTQEQFYDDWDKENYDNLTSELKENIYKRYVVKCLVFQRAGFSCENEGCKADDDLTMHHIRFQKNEGRHTLKNGACICHKHHQGYHKGKNSLTIRGYTYKIHETEEINWNEVKSWGKEIRKNNKELHGYKISWELMAILLKWLNIMYEDMELEDNDY